MRNKWNEPELMVNDHHGVYMMQLWVELQKKDNTPAWKQICKQVGKESIDSLLAGPDDEFHFDSCQEIENMTFKTQTGQKFTIQYCEGGIWAIPFCFKGKKANEFFGNC
jgi:redox-sensitive bicupin YhaK (pirin superfamily)